MINPAGDPSREWPRMVSGGRIDQMQESSSLLSHMLDMILNFFKIVWINKHFSFVRIHLCKNKTGMICLKRRCNFIDNNERSG
jgi:hypothetical protein